MTKVDRVIDKPENIYLTQARIEAPRAYHRMSSRRPETRPVDFTLNLASGLGSVTRMDKCSLMTHANM